MQLASLSPVHVARIVWRRDARTWMLTAVCKASFDLLPGEMRLSAQQDVINERDQHWEDDHARSVHSPGDLAPFKPHADVTLVGNAFAPPGKQVRSLVARLVCGTIDKSIAVFGDRPRPSHPEPNPFTRMALRYERAAGGPGTANPVGSPERVPNLEPTPRREGAGHQPGLRPDKPGYAPDPVPPIGFGPIAPDWPERRAKLHHYTAWSPSEPFPEDLDSSYFNVAPADQQLTALRNDQQLHLEHLHPEHARLTTRLPGMYPQAFVDRPGTQPVEIEMRLDGLWIDTDRGRCAATWRAQIPLSRPDEPGRVLVAMVGARQQLGWEDIARLDAALNGGQKDPPSRAPEPPPRSHQHLPQIGRDPEDEEDRLSTTVSMNTNKVVPMVVPPLPPVPNASLSAKRTGTLQGLPRRPPPDPPMPAPPPPRPPIDSEATSTDLYVPGGEAAGDQAPAWLSPAPASVPAPTPAPAPAQASPSLPQPVPQSLVQPLEAPPPPSAEARSPWAGGGPAVTPAPAVSMPAPVTPAPAPEPRPAPLRALAADEVIDLIWFDPGAVPRVRARWSSIVDALDFEPLDPRHDLPVDDPAASRDRHHVFGVLTRAEATDVRGVSREIMDAIGDRGRFTPPLLVIGGELRFPFDDLEMLKTAAAAAKPLAKDDKRLTDLLDMLAELMDTPLLQGSPGAVESLLRDLTLAVQQSKRPLPVKYLDAHLERVLLEKRRYQKRAVFGGPCIRALLGSGTSAMPAYLPEPLADKLPLVTQMKARLIAEAGASQDQYEAHPHALRVVALARVMGLDGARR